MSKSEKRRNKPRIQFTLDKDVIEALRKQTTNMSQFVNKTLRAVLFGEPVTIVEISPVGGAGGGIRTLEPLRDWTLNPAPLSARQPPLVVFEL